jgi:hypothetical protein
LLQNAPQLLQILKKFGANFQFVALPTCDTTPLDQFQKAASDVSLGETSSDSEDVQGSAMRGIGGAGAWV